MASSSELDWTVSQTFEADGTDATADEKHDGTDATADGESTDATADEEEESTDATADGNLRLDANSTDATKDFDIAMSADHTDATMDKFITDHTEETQDKFIANITIGGIARKLPDSEIVVRDIAVAAAPVAALATESDAAFGQWLAGSRLPSLN